MREIAKALALCDECFNCPLMSTSFLCSSWCAVKLNITWKRQPSTGRCYVLRSLSILLRQPQKLAWVLFKKCKGCSMLASYTQLQCRCISRYQAHYWDPVSGVDSVRWRDFCMPWPRQHWGPNMTQHWTNSAWDLTAALIFASWHVLSCESSIKHWPKK